MAEVDVPTTMLALSLFLLTHSTYISFRPTSLSWLIGTAPVFISQGLQRVNHISFLRKLTSTGLEARWIVTVHCLCVCGGGFESKLSFNAKPCSSQIMMINHHTCIIARSTSVTEKFLNKK